MGRPLPLIGPDNYGTPLTANWRTRLLAAVFTIGALVLVILFLLSPKSEAGKVELRLAGVQQATNGTLLVRVVLTNGASRTLNVMDDALGDPAYVLDTGSKSGKWLTPMVNHLKINLMPGGSLTNTLLITNAPPRFRLKVVIRDLVAERNWVWMTLRSMPVPLPLRLAEKLEKLEADQVGPLPASVWIEAPSHER